MNNNTNTIIILDTHNNQLVKGEKYFIGNDRNPSKYNGIKVFDGKKYADFEDGGVDLTLKDGIWKSTVPLRKQDSSKGGRGKIRTYRSGRRSTRRRSTRRKH